MVRNNPLAPTKALYLSRICLYSEEKSEISLLYNFFSLTLNLAKTNKGPLVKFVMGAFVLSNSKPLLNANKNKEILLVFPGKYNAPDPQVPLSLLHLASALQQSNYKVRIFDMRTEDYRSLNIGDPLFVGISCMSGLQIGYGIEFAKKVRLEKPFLEIVWGGVHPSLLPEQTAKNELVDIVVRGEGDQTISNLANNLASGKSLEKVKGLSFKNNGNIENTAEADLIDLDTIPVELPYDLLDLDKYPALKAGRIHIQTSRGCPHRCGFCYNILYNNKSWRGKTPKRVLDEIEYLLKKFPNAKVIDPIDDNFFVDKKRVEDICNGILKRGIKVAWRANCRFDYLSTYEPEFLKLLEKAGCAELDFGGETGSERLQQFICKDVNHDQIMQSVENLKKYAPTIEPYASWMSGLPTETNSDLNATFDLMDHMREANPKTQHFGIFVYTPFPSPVLNQLPPEFKPPQTLEEWGKIDVFQFKPPWHSKKQVARLRAISAVARYAFFPEARINERSFSFKIAYGFVSRMAKYRWRHRYFGFPIDMKIVNYLARKMRGYL
jgi:anaerobic magnesium-protoporphyrin IX monomethyl ester cyclase